MLFPLVFISMAEKSEQPHWEGSKSPYSHQMQPHQECLASLCVPIRSTLDLSGAGIFLGGWRAIPDLSQVFCPWIRGQIPDLHQHYAIAELMNDTQAPENSFFFHHRSVISNYPSCGIVAARGRAVTEPSLPDTGAVKTVI